MIFVDRAARKPAGFDARAAGWMLEFDRLRAAGRSVTEAWGTIRARMRADADALGALFHGKCAFCESDPRHVSNMQIEHYRPKHDARFSGLICAWENWLPSCQRCNQKKSTRFPGCEAPARCEVCSDPGNALPCVSSGPCLLDPGAERPEAHLSFRNEEIAASTARGAVTIRMTDLSNVELVRARRLWLGQIDFLLMIASGAARGSPDYKAAIDLLHWSLSDAAPWCAMTRSYLSRLGYPAALHPERRRAVVLAAPLDELRRLLASADLSRLD